MVDLLGDTVANWDLLAKGLQGVVDLIIEDAGPTIAATANKLLLDSYDGRFSIRIVTQKEQANGRLVECFNITVLDNETEIESYLLKKSGGESVWIDKALVDAVGIYHQDAAGMRYECRFADEADDGLTPSRKAKYYQMDRAALDVGEYDRCYFISHSDVGLSSADFVLEV